MGPVGEQDERGLRGAWRDFQWHEHAAPGAALAPYVARYAGAGWDLRGQPPYHQRMVPYPSVHLTFVNGVARIVGVARAHITRVLDGAGWMFGVTFRPGCFRPFLGAPVSTITGRVLPAAEVFPGLPEYEIAHVGDTAHRPAARDLWMTERRAIIEVYLRDRLPPPDPAAQQAAALVACVAEDPAITRVDHLAARAGTGVRSLQRLFAEYVGAGPKWVIRRYRIDEATRHLAGGAPVDWAALAAGLGYADQSHFIRDFTALVGETPTAYARRYPSAPTS